MELLVDNGSVGSIIGKGGVTIRKLTSESGALIQVQGRDDAVTNRERRVTVTHVREWVVLLQWSRKPTNLHGPPFELILMRLIHLGYDSSVTCCACAFLD